MYGLYGLDNLSTHNICTYACMYVCIFVCMSVKIMYVDIFTMNGWSRELIVANAGDCRAVLCRKGMAVEMSRDHKPDLLEERVRIEALGGYVYDGYLNGYLSVARAFGNWHVEGLKGACCPLSVEPEVRRVDLTEEDEFMIIGCDGLWDVFSNENAVSFARRELQRHNDPVQCSRELVNEALRRNSSDNLTVVIVCFHAVPPPELHKRFVGRRRNTLTNGV